MLGLEPFDDKDSTRVGRALVNPYPVSSSFEKNIRAGFFALLFDFECMGVSLVFVNFLSFLSFRVERSLKCDVDRLVNVEVSDRGFNHSCCVNHVSQSN